MIRDNNWHPIAGGITEYRLKRRDYCIIKSSFINNFGCSNGRHYHKHINVANVSGDFKPFSFKKTLDIRFNLFIDRRIYRATVLNKNYPFWSQESLKSLRTVYPHKWIEIGENLAYKVKNGLVFFKFDPSLIIGDSESKISVLICSNRKDHYIFKKLFENPYNLIFNHNKKLNKKEKFYLKCLELGFNCFETKKILNFNREKNKKRNEKVKSIGYYFNFK